MEILLNFANLLRTVNILQLEITVRDVSKVIMAMLPMDTRVIV